MGVKEVVDDALKTYNRGLNEIELRNDRVAAQYFATSFFLYHLAEDFEMMHRSANMFSFLHNSKKERRKIYYKGIEEANLIMNYLHPEENDQVLEGLLTDSTILELARELNIKVA